MKRSACLLITASLLLLLAPVNRGEDAPAPPASANASAPVPLKDATSRMTVPEGFRVSLFAGEPDVVQPIAFAIDDRGRLWVAEAMSYPTWQEEDTEPQDRRDRIVILEDTDGDGRHDNRTVFADKLINLSGIELGFGGVWVCSTPNLMFLPDADGDDKPDGPPKVLLNGFSYDVQHNVFNGLTWGPDGWLYGMHGILATSNVGPPSLPPDDPKRVPINCGVWRVHPVTHAFEVVAWGTTNPFGLDFDDLGQMFVTNCVIAHAFHVIPGAHYVRMYGEDLNPHVYALMQSPADHLHWGGGDWTESRGGLGAHSEAGGGHAHVGAMIYLGDNWPDRYRKTLFTCNLHGTRVNNDRLEHAGSGYSIKHGPDFLFANDPWFRGLELQYGPDGGVYMTDWSDTDECHDYEDIHRENGRVFKIVYGDVKRQAVDVAKQTDEQLVGLLSHNNEWFARHARRVLHERSAAGKLGPHAHYRMRLMMDTEVAVPRRLSAVWALHVTGGLKEDDLAKLMSDNEPYVRGWAVRLATEVKQVTPAMRDRLAKLAAEDASPVVRLHLASAMQRLPLEQRWPLAEALAARAEDAKDANIPLMIWYGIEPAVAADPVRAAKLIERARIPLLRQHIARRLASL